MRTVSLSLLAVVLMLSCPAVAQDRPLVEDLGVGAPAKVPETTFPDEPLPVEFWIGEEFIFLPKPLLLQEHGYMFCRNASQRGFSSSLQYKDGVGRIGVAQKIEEDSLERNLYLKMKDNGEVIRCRGRSSWKHKQLGVQGLALVKDIVLGRERWEGNTYYANQTSFTTYDPEADKYGKLEVQRFGKVKVVKVSAGTSNVDPIRVVVESEDGGQGYFETGLSWTNSTIPTKLGFDWHLLEKNPRTQHKWSKKVWKAIEDRTVFVGMTEPQMKMAMFSPLSVTTNVTKRGEVTIWRYATCTVTTRNGKVVSVTFDSK